MDGQMTRKSICLGKKYNLMNFMSVFFRPVDSNLPKAISKHLNLFSDDKSIVGKEEEGRRLNSHCLVKLGQNKFFEIGNEIWQEVKAVNRIE